MALALRARTASDDSSERRRSLAGEIAPQLVLLAAVCLARRAVLHGWGGSGDPRAGLAGTTAADLRRLRPDLHRRGGSPAAARLRGRHDDPGADRLRDRAAGQGRRLPAARFTPLAFAVAAAAPLFAAGWAVGARYYYLPAVGLCWAVAEALAGVEVGPAARVTLTAVLLLVGALQAAERRQEVISYDRRVAAARRAVAAGLGAGHHVFHVDGGIKDLDLAVKEDPVARGRRRARAGRRARVVRRRAAQARGRGGAAGRPSPPLPPERRLPLRRRARHRARPPGRRAGSRRGAGAASPICASSG